MKPIDPDELMEAVRKAHSAPAPNQDHVDLLLSNVKGNKNLYLTGYQYFGKSTCRKAG
ncbi:MAG: hypothetical protein R3B93_04440 [Bacteroidia bacterium]